MDKAIFRKLFFMRLIFLTLLYRRKIALKIIDTFANESNPISIEYENNSTELRFFFLKKSRDNTNVSNVRV
tara:strand:+ start:304 stop:516 length:213 start_codon:yes stop_codon:yes gene_type:complete